MRTEVHLALKQDPFVMNRHGDLLPVTRDLEHLETLAFNLSASVKAVRENLRRVDLHWSLLLMCAEEVVQESGQLARLLSW
jgi:hypothetical protein